MNNNYQQVVRRQMKFDERVKRLVNDVVMAFYIAKDIPHIHRQIESLSHLATELVDFLIECCIRIRAYSLRSFIGKISSLSFHLFNEQN